MANYRVGDVIRLTRKAAGITQEQLSDGICSVETLFRIE
jgi:transcriptional regulator with XRE-family HTH domain